MSTSSLRPIYQPPSTCFVKDKKPSLLRSAGIFLGIASAPLTISGNEGGSGLALGLFGNEIELPNAHTRENNHSGVCPDVHTEDLFDIPVRDINVALSNLLIKKACVENVREDECNSPNNAGDVLDGVSFGGSFSSELLDKESVNIQNNGEISTGSKRVSSKVKVKTKGKGKSKKSRKLHKLSMKNKTGHSDLPSVAKISSKKIDVGLDLGAYCSAIKINQNQPLPRTYHLAPANMVKNGDYYKTVYTLPLHHSSQPYHSASLPVKSQRKPSSVHSISDFKQVSVRSSSPKPVLTRRSVSQANGKYMKKITKIYQSQKQSGTVEVCGMDVPCAPPATPTTERLKTHQYIPSLNDVMAQRAVKLRLEKMEKKEQKKVDKKKDEETRQEKLQQKDKMLEKKRKQRLEIYALNKVMTELENKKFQEFCQAKGIS